MNAKLFIAAAAAVLVGACGGGGSSAADPLTAVPASASESSGGLIAYLKALTAQSSETRDPVSVEGLSPPKPDNTDPESINS